MTPSPPENQGPPDHASGDPPRLEEIHAAKDLTDFYDDHPGKRPRVAFRQGDSGTTEEFASVEQSPDGRRSVLTYEDGRTVTVDPEREVEWAEAVEE